MSEDIGYHRRLINAKGLNSIYIYTREIYKFNGEKEAIFSVALYLLNYECIFLLIQIGMV